MADITYNKLEICAFCVGVGTYSVTLIFNFKNGPKIESPAIKSKLTFNAWCVFVVSSAANISHEIISDSIQLRKTLHLVHIKTILSLFNLNGYIIKFYSI